LAFIAVYWAHKLAIVHLHQLCSAFVNIMQYRMLVQSATMWRRWTTDSVRRMHTISSASVLTTQSRWNL